MYGEQKHTKLVTCFDDQILLSLPFQLVARVNLFPKVSVGIVKGTGAMGLLALGLPLPCSRLQAPWGQPLRGPGAASLSGPRHNLRRLVLRTEIKLILEDLLIFREVLSLFNSEMS